MKKKSEISLSKKIKKPSKKITINFDESNQPTPNQLPEENIDIENENENKLKLEENISESKKIKKYPNISICFPDSIIALHQSSELRSYFISEIARMASIFTVDEIIILKDHTYKAKSPNFDATQYLAINLQYLETPQYLRKNLFPIHPDLKNAGLMNPIESKHHLKNDEWDEYREGIVLDRPAKENSGSWVEIGLKKQAKIDFKLQAGTRVTVKLNEKTLEINEKYYTGNVVPQTEPKQLINTYWGYSVRIANSIKDVFKYCPFGDGYDAKVYLGNDSINKKNAYKIKKRTFNNYERILVVFGGFDGLEAVLEGEELSKLKTNKLFEKFDFCYEFESENFGVKHLRLEEEMFIFLNLLKTNLNQKP